MIRSAAVVIAAAGGWGAGCGAGAASTSPMGNLHDVHQQDERVRLCNAAATLHAASCGVFATIATTQLEDCSVADALYLSGYAACLADTGCDAVQACVAQVDAGSGAPYAGPLGSCEDGHATIPVALSQTEVAKRYGAADRTFADSPSSAKQPIEVCGGPQQIDYLMRVTCFDGSHPFADRAAAATARAHGANGGSCGRVIDHVVATCPERRYDVFIDAYRCPMRG